MATEAMTFRVSGNQVRCYDITREGIESSRASRWRTDDLHHPTRKVGLDNEEVDNRERHAVDCLVDDDQLDAASTSDRQPGVTRISQS